MRHKLTQSHYTVHESFVRQVLSGQLSSHNQFHYFVQIKIQSVLNCCANNWIQKSHQELNLKEGASQKRLNLFEIHQHLNLILHQSKVCISVNRRRKKNWKSKFHHYIHFVLKMVLQPLRKYHQQLIAVCRLQMIYQKKWKIIYQLKMKHQKRWKPMKVCDRWVQVLWFQVIIYIFETMFGYLECNYQLETHFFAIVTFYFD